SGNAAADDDDPGHGGIVSSGVWPRPNRTGGQAGVAKDVTHRLIRDLLRGRIRPATAPKGPATVPFWQPTDPNGPSTDPNGPSTDTNGPTTDPNRTSTDPNGPSTDPNRAPPDP